MAVSISRVSFEHHRYPLGIAETEPRISWRFEGDASDWEQTGYDLEIVRGADGSPQVHSANTSQSLLVPWPEEPLETAEFATVRARAHGQDGQPSTPWSDWVTVETGLLGNGDWGDAVPITSDRSVNASEPKRPTYFRRPFTVGSNASTSENSEIQSARLYITAFGMYEAEINGKRVGENVLAPGWQTYHHRHVYDSYDVTDLVQGGDNAIGVLVGEGWYAGRLFSLAESPVNNQYGDEIGHVSLLVVTLADGTIIEVPSDTSWTTGLGPVVDSQIYNGETYDSRLEAEIKGWSTAKFDDGDWDGVKELPASLDALVPPDGPHVRRLEEIKPQDIFTSPSGKTLIDFGQNFAGWLRVTVSGPKDTNISLSHAEVLDDGELATRPLRTAEPIDNLILHGDGEQTWEPKFTFHGFRYVQVDNWPADETPLTADAITGIVVYSDMEQTGWFECSHELLSKFHDNVRWSMKGNFISIPTDCPQRDERAGWTGDAHAFGPTSNFLYDTAGFWRGWHKDVWFEMQQTDGMVVPFIVPLIPPDGMRSEPTAVWGDVAVANPWSLWLSFGDEGMLAEQYHQAKAWIETGISRNEVGLWDRSTFQFGDWLDPESPPDDAANATTSAHLVADAYLIHMTELLANISAVLGDDARAEKYQDQQESLREAFYDAWIEEGHMTNETQTAYALGLNFDVFAEEDREQAGETLRELIADNDYLVGTGFAGTPALGHSLRKIGATEDFYSMLLQTQVPSWLYQVVQNGTTTWERWDSLLEDGSVNPGEMTSFNHYAFGAVADWIHQVIGGLAPGSPGWKIIDVSPVPGGDITSAEATFVSGYGEIRTEWSIDDDGFHLQLQVPPNSKAVVSLPHGGDVTEVGSGSHEFHDSGYLSRRAAS